MVGGFQARHRNLDNVIKTSEIKTGLKVTMANVGNGKKHC